MTYVNSYYHSQFTLVKANPLESMWCSLLKFTAKNPLQKMGEKFSATLNRSEIQSHSASLQNPAETNAHSKYKSKIFTWILIPRYGPAKAHKTQFNSGFPALHLSLVNPRKSRIPFLLTVTWNVLALPESSYFV